MRERVDCSFDLIIRLSILALLRSIFWINLNLPESANSPEMWKHLTTRDKLQNHVQIWIILERKIKMRSFLSFLSFPSFYFLYLCYLSTPLLSLFSFHSFPPLLLFYSTLLSLFFLFSVYFLFSFFPFLFVSHLVHQADFPIPLVV